MKYPSGEQYERLYKQERYSIFYECIGADSFTPVSLLKKIQEKSDYYFLFESVEGGERLGRYSFIGYDPLFIWKVENDKAFLDGKPVDGDIPENFQKLIDQSACTKPDFMPPGIAGVYGYFGFEMIRFFEDVKLNTDKNGLGIPDSIFFMPEKMIVFDHVKNHAFLIVHHANNTETTVADNIKSAHEKLDAIQNLIRTPQENEIKAVPLNNTALSESIRFESNTEKAAFLQKVDRAKDYIKAGDIFQLVLSQRFEMPLQKTPLEFYRTLRRINPSPFLFFLWLKDFAVTGSSPEILVRVRDNTMTIRPIAGTRKRGKNGDEDKALADDLLADPKECAEHLMLLDLGRNDVGRVCETGSVEVTDRFFIEHYSHVMHIVSNVQGQLRQEHSALDALRSGFPAGTVSGAPKIRAIEIIDELEREKRGVYGGCIGYIDATHNMDTCIALRTAIIKDNRLYAQAGAGIVYDSIPEMEYEETVNKAKALLLAGIM